MPNAGAVQLCALRVSKLAADGSLDYGPNSLYVTDTAISLQVGPVMQDGEDIIVTNGCGDVMVDYASPPAYRRVDIELSLAIPEPELVFLLTRNSRLLKLDGETVGWGHPELFKRFTDEGVCLEGWQKRIVGGVVGVPSAWRWIFPRVNKMQVGQRTLENGSVETVLMGHGYMNVNIGNGPVDDFDSLTDDPIVGPYDYVEDVAIPEAEIGLQALVPAGS